MRTTGDWIRFCLTAGASALGKRRFLNCVWELTYRCNAQCSMCDYWRRPSNAADELTTEEITTGLEKVAKYGCRLVNFTGGEPTLQQDLEQVVAHASGLGMWTSTVTNGSLLTRNRLKNLRDAGLDSLLVSLDSVDPLVHDGSRGLPGLHSRALDCLRWLAEDFLTGHRTGGFMTVVSSCNTRTVCELVRLAEQLGVYVLLQPHHGQKTDASGQIAEIPSSLAEQFVEMRRRSPSMLNSQRYLRSLSGASRPTASACNAGRKYFSVDPFGGLHPCVDTPSLGHVLHDEISVISSQESMAAVHNCPGCWYCFRGEADVTLSPGGCLEKMGLGIRVFRRNGKTRRIVRRTVPRLGVVNEGKLGGDAR